MVTPTSDGKQPKHPEKVVDTRGLLYGSETVETVFDQIKLNQSPSNYAASLKDYEWSKQVPHGTPTHQIQKAIKQIIQAA